MNGIAPETPVDVGDIVEVSVRRVGGSRQLAEVLDVIGEPGHQHFRVLWEDGHESIFFPGNDVVIHPRSHAHDEHGHARPPHEGG